MGKQFSGGQSVVDDKYTVEDLIKSLQELPGISEVGVDIGDGFFMPVIGAKKLTEDEDFYGELHQDAVIIVVED